MKFRVADLDVVRSRLAALGARAVSPLEFEDNWVLDDPAGGLARTGQILRVRSYGATGRITFKGPAIIAEGVKSRPEHEVEIDDPQRALALLAGLGFFPVRRYQKRRELWRSGAVEVALDVTPMGEFVELEGPRAELARFAVDLGFDPGAALAGTYLGLWAEYRKAHPGAPEDMTFGGEPHPAPTRTHY